jgi:glycosyltransferase involved in cell wall biosynthesis
MYQTKTIGVVIPAYNEEKLITAVLGSIPDYIDRVYVVDDASQDNTAEIASRIASAAPQRIKVISHPQNSGVGKSIVTGYRNCLADKIDIAVVMAGDNQMSPEQLPALLAPIIDGQADYTVGDRLSNLKHMQGMSHWRRLGNFLLKWLTRIAAWNFSICDPQNGYTAVTHKALSRLDLDKIYPSYGYCNDMLVKFSATGARIKQVQMPAVYGQEKSKIKYWKYIPKVSWLLLRDFIWRIKFGLLGR